MEDKDLAGGRPSVFRKDPEEESRVHRWVGEYLATWKLVPLWVVCRRRRSLGITREGLYGILPDGRQCNL